MVSNLIGDSGRPIANQFVIDGKNFFGFQSYQTMILYLENGIWKLNWEFYDGNLAVRTHTTIKNLNVFLQRYTKWNNWRELEHDENIRFFNTPDQTTEDDLPF